MTPSETTPGAGEVSEAKARLAFGVEPAGRTYRLRLARYAALAEAILEFLRSRPEGQPVRLLDVGVGFGRTLRYLEPHAESARIEFHGIDSSLRRLENVYRAESWHLVEGDVEAGLPFDDAHFDIVVCEQVLEHLAAPEPVLSDMTRVLAPCGLLVIGVPTFPPGFAHARRRGVARALARGRPREHLQTFTPASLVRLIEESGPLEVLRRRAFRVFSGGVLLPLEDHRWWLRLQGWTATHLSWLAVETQVTARKSEGG